MDLTDIPAIRLLNLQISQTKFSNPEEIVKFLGAVQAQDFMGAKWALGLRLKKITDAQIEEQFNEGKILRTHVLRPTWHFISPKDIRWMLQLSSPQVKRLMSYYNKQLELDEPVFKRANSIIEQSLKSKNFLTRQQIAKKLTEGGIKGTGQRIGHIIMNTELDGIICSGPRNGKQFSYALIDEVVPKTKRVSRDEALARLAEIFFKSRGPATTGDFSKWSGLSITDSKVGLEQVKPHFKREIISGKEYWFSKSLPSAIPQSPLVLLLPNYDEYISSYADYSIISEPGNRRNLDLKGNALFWNHIIINGRVVGSWRRVFKPKAVEIELAPFRDLTKKEKQAIEKVALEYGKFLNLKVNFKSKQV